MSNLKKLLGTRIRELRRKRGLTQEKLAELAEISAPSISKIESGIYHPSEENIERMAKILDVEIYELYKFDKTSNAEITKDKINSLINKANNEQLKLILKIVTDIINWKQHREKSKKKYMLRVRFCRS